MPEKSTIFLTISASQTRKVGESLARKILKSRSAGGAAVLALVGELGGGKTTFLQGFARGLGMKKEKILSPTFIIMRKLKNLYHIDCYRIRKPKELLDLDFKKIIADPENIVAVEWADRVKRLLPKNTILVEFKPVGKNKRKIRIAKEAL